MFIHSHFLTLNNYLVMPDTMYFTFLCPTDIAKSILEAQPDTVEHFYVFSDDAVVLKVTTNEDTIGAFLTLCITHAIDITGSNT